MTFRAAVLVAACTAVACGNPRERQDAVAAASGPRAAPAASLLDTGAESLYSQGNEELIIRDFFQDMRGGVFLDVGCASPVRNSNTYYLEKRLGWSGIGVDALPEFAPAWSRRRPRSRFFNYIVTDHADTVEPFFRADPRGISSVDREKEGPARKPVKVHEIRTPTITLDRLLEIGGVTRLDLLSLDIEGHELTALAGFDVERYRPALACVEAKPENRRNLVGYFAGHGYDRIERYDRYDQTNYYFSPRVRRQGRTAPQ